MLIFETLATIMAKGGDVDAPLREGDLGREVVMVHHPYESFDIVEDP